MVCILYWLQLIEDTITRGNAHANLDKMETECVSGSGSSGTTEYGVEDGATKEPKVSHASVSCQFDCFIAFYKILHFRV